MFKISALTPLKVFTTVRELRKFRSEITGSLGFVPTMGALHDGHLSLIKQSKSENSISGCSIFVNPIQFNNQEDFQKYPVDIDSDLIKLISAGCDFVFVPTVEEMYPTPPEIKFDFGALEKILEGAFRPGHFNGVAIVVSKFLHTVNPDKIYFGRKDLQQTLVIKRLISDLSFPQKLIVSETLREKDGLAMSSRNVRLSPEEREIAPQLYQTLKTIERRISEGENVNEVVSEEEEKLFKVPGIKLEYLQAVDANNLLRIENTFSGEIAICIAAYFGNVRLIDNVVFVKE